LGRALVGRLLSEAIVHGERGCCHGGDDQSGGEVLPDGARARDANVSEGKLAQKPHRAGDE
jgi:hypothetical protein